MNELPDLDRLSHAEKNDLIRTLFAQAKFLTAQVAALTAKVSELEGRLAQNCTIRPYLATLHKQGDNLFHAPALTFQGHPPQPRFGSDQGS